MDPRHNSKILKSREIFFIQIQDFPFSGGKHLAKGGLLKPRKVIFGHSGECFIGRQADGRQIFEENESHEIFFLVVAPID